MNTARFSSTLLTTALCLAALFLLQQPSNCTAGTYTSSAHGNTTDGVSRAGLNAETTDNYATGNCAHCHEQHASVIGSEPTPTGGPGNYLGMANETGITNAEQTLCFYCHGTGTSANNESSGTNDDIETDISKTYGHHVTLSDSSHKADETIAEIVAAKHIECTDCHNPHAAGHTLHHTHDGTNILDPTATPTSHTNAIATTTSPLYQTTGIEPTYTGMDGDWDDDTIGYGSYSAIQTATKEYQICFKCHTKANTDVETWGDEETDPAMAWTDVGMEFNPNNKSFHPVVTGLSDASSNSSALNTNQLIAPWNVDVGTQTMYCTDCHESDSGLAGPHGSAVKWMLAGTNKAWPYTDRGNNGRKVTTTYRTLGDMDLYINTSQGVFCRNCHPNDVPSSPNINEAHNQANHSSTACVDCHIRIPHGGKVSRLIAADNNANYTNLPNRYTADGAGENSFNDTTTTIREFIKTAPDSYVKGNCYSTNSNCDGAMAHGADISGESW